MPQSAARSHPIDHPFGIKDSAGQQVSASESEVVMDEDRVDVVLVEEVQDVPILLPTVIRDERRSALSAPLTVVSSELLRSGAPGCPTAWASRPRMFSEDATAWGRPSSKRRGSNQVLDQASTEAILSSN